jgi:hypothetical protein
MVAKLPQKLKDAENEIQQVEAKLQEIESVRGAHDDCQRFKNIELPDLESQKESSRLEKKRLEAEKATVTIQYNHSIIIDIWYNLSIHGQVDISPYIPNQSRKTQSTQKQGHTFRNRNPQHVV